MDVHRHANSDACLDGGLIERLSAERHIIALPENYSPEMDKKRLVSVIRRLRSTARAEISQLPLCLHEGQGTYFTYASFGRRTDCIISSGFGMIGFRG